MFTRIWLQILALSVVLVPLRAGAAIWYVHPDSSLNSVQTGLDSCSAGDTVLVGPGTYYENIEWPYVMGIRLISECGPAATMIDGGGSGGVIHLALMQDDSLAMVIGFTLRNGVAWQGGGIHATGGKPLISGNIITDNTAQWPTARAFPAEGPPPEGGGIYSVWSSPRIIDNVISNNSALYNGGGIACNCDAANIAPYICQNTITDNSAHCGGGVYIVDPYAMTTVRENLIAMNTADYGGGITCYYVMNPMLRIANNTVTMNTADSTGGGIWCELSSSPIIDSCTISDNAGDGIFCHNHSSPLIIYCNITGNLGFAVRNDDPTALVAAENNWWGDATGPFHQVTNPTGLGDTVSDYVDFDPWQTMPGVHEFPPSPLAAIFLQVNPNPFRKLTTVSFSMGHRAERIAIDLYDAAGRPVNSFDLGSCIMDHVSAVSWDGTDAAGNRLPAGVYFLRLTAGEFSAVTKVVLTR